MPKTTNTPRSQAHPSHDWFGRGVQRCKTCGVLKNRPQALTQCTMTDEEIDKAKVTNGTATTRQAMLGIPDPVVTVQPQEAEPEKVVNTKPEFDVKEIPLPITHQDFTMASREFTVKRETDEKPPAGLYEHMVKGMMPDIYKRPIDQHGGKKYLRAIRPADARAPVIMVDVYAVLKAFDVRCPATAHAIKKLLCAGLRDKGSREDDLKGAMDALWRAIELCREEA